MKIAHITSAHPRDDVRINLKECQSLLRAGYDVTLLVADGLGNDDQLGLKIIDVGRSNGRIGRMIGATYRIYKACNKQKFDIYHAHDPELLPVCMLLKLNGNNVIFDAHEDVPKQILSKHYIPAFLRGLIAAAFAKLEALICSRLDGVITATPSIKSKFLFINKRAIDINNYPILGELYQDKGVDFKNSNEICYVGNIAGIRGIREIVRALELTKFNVRLNLVGAFAEPDVYQEVKKYKGWSKVNELGVMGRDGVRNVMSRSIAGLVTLHPTTNYLDSLPIKMFEYMSAGLPVIASNFTLWEKIILGNKCGLCVNPLEPESIAKAIDEIMNDQIAANRMGKNGNDAVLSDFNWSKEESKLILFYEQLIIDERQR